MSLPCVTAGVPCASAFAAPSSPVCSVTSSNERPNALDICVSVRLPGDALSPLSPSLLPLLDVRVVRIMACSRQGRRANTCDPAGRSLPGRAYWMRAIVSPTGMQLTSTAVPSGCFVFSAIVAPPQLMRTAS
jgi:hypothetical protein